jgi:hypothetical protein
VIDFKLFQRRGDEGADGGGVDGVPRLELDVAHVFAGAAQQSGGIGHRTSSPYNPRYAMI